MIYTKNIKVLLNSYWSLVIIIPVYLLLRLLFFNTGFFWDSITIISKPATYLYENSLFNFVYNGDFDNGDPQTLQFCLATIWRIFGKSIFVTHLFFAFFSGLTLYQLYKLVISIFDQKTAQYVFTLICFEPTFMTQITGLYQDIFLFNFALIAMRAFLTNKNGLLLISMLLLCMVSRRAILICFGLMLAITIIEIFEHKKNIKQFIAEYLKVFAPSIVFVFIFIGWRMQNYGWFFTTEATDSGKLIENWNMFFKNIATFCRYLLDNGRFFLWAIALVLIIRGKYSRYILLKNKKIVVILLATLIVMLSVTLSIQNPFGSRYFVIQYIIFLLLYSKLIIYHITNKKTKYYFIISYIALLSGNLWIYPETLSQSWDSSLAHYPYFELRKNTINYFNEKNIDLSDVGVGFPMGSKLAYVDVSKDYFNGFSNIDFKLNKWIVYSNIFNYSDENISIIKKMTPIKEWRTWNVFVKIYNNEKGL